MTQLEFESKLVYRAKIAEDMWDEAIKKAVESYEEDILESYIKEPGPFKSGHDIGYRTGYVAALEWVIGLHTRTVKESGLCKRKKEAQYISYTNCIITK